MIVQCVHADLEEEEHLLHTATDQTRHYEQCVHLQSTLAAIADGTLLDRLKLPTQLVHMFCSRPLVAAGTALVEKFCQCGLFCHLVVIRESALPSHLLPSFSQGAWCAPSHLFLQRCEPLTR